MCTYSGVFEDNLKSTRTFSCNVVKEYFYDVRMHAYEFLHTTLILTISNLYEQNMKQFLPAIDRYA